MKRYYITKHIVTYGLIVTDTDPQDGLGLAEGKEFIEYQRPRSPFPTMYEVGKDAFEDHATAALDARSRVVHEIHKVRRKLVLLGQMEQALGNIERDK